MTTTEDSSVNNPDTGKPTEVPSKGRRVNAGIGIVLLLAVLVAVVAWYLHAQGFEDTDDAQVDGHLVPITSRIDGTIKSVRVDDNQLVKAGDLLVLLDPQDEEIAFRQAKAQLDQAKAQLTATSPSLPITRISNETTLASGSADVAAAGTAMAAARQDLALAEARLRGSRRTAIGLTKILFDIRLSSINKRFRKPIMTSSGQ